MKRKSDTENISCRVSLKGSVVGRISPQALVVIDRWQNILPSQ